MTTHVFIHVPVKTNSYSANRRTCEANDPVAGMTWV